MAGLIFWMVLRDLLNANFWTDNTLTLPTSAIEVQSSILKRQCMHTHFVCFIIVRGEHPDITEETSRLKLEETQSSLSLSHTGPCVAVLYRLFLSFYRSVPFLYRCILLCTALFVYVPFPRTGFFQRLRGGALTELTYGTGHRRKKHTECDLRN